MSLEDFLSGESQGPQNRHSKKCSICKNQVLASEVARYVAGRQDGTIHHSIHYMWVRYFGPVHGVMAVNTLYTHIRLHLGADI